MWYNFLANIGTNSGVRAGDSCTLTGPHNTQATYIQGTTLEGISNPELNILDDSNDISGTFKLQVNLPGTTSDGQPRTWSFGEVKITIGNMSLAPSNGYLRLGGGEDSSGFPNGTAATSIAVGGMDYVPVRLNSGIDGPGVNDTINLIGYDSSLIQPLAKTEKADGNGWAYFPVKAIKASASGSVSPLVFADNIGDQVVAGVSTSLPMVSASGSVIDNDGSGSEGSASVTVSLPGIDD